MIITLIYIYVTLHYLPTIYLRTGFPLVPPHAALRSSAHTEYANYSSLHDDEVL